MTYVGLNGGSVIGAVRGMISSKNDGRATLQAQIRQAVPSGPPSQSAVIRPVPERDLSSKAASRAALPAEVARAVASLPTASSRRTMLIAAGAAAVAVLYVATRKRGRRKR